MSVQAEDVLFLMCDEMAPYAGWGARPFTPTLDALRRRGVTFSAAYTPSPICVPTRASIACGRYLHEIGHWSSAEAYDGRIKGWGHALQDADVETTSIGKLHYRNDTDDTGFKTQIEPLHIHENVGWVRALLRKPLCGYDATEGFAEEIGPGETEYIQFDRRVTQAASSWLRAPTRRKKPWCGFVSWLSPHYPLQAPQDYFDQYDPTRFESEAEDTPEHPILAELAGFFAHDRHFTRQTRGVARAGYYALWNFIDDQVKAVLAALEASEQADDTLIIFTSDHGEMLGEKGFWGKSTMYESSARVPLIVAGPGVEPAERDDPVSLIDIAPTLCDVFGVEHDFPGRSLLASPDPDRAVISEYHDGGASAGITMLRWNEGAERWKYVHYAEGHPPQLFELISDPQETCDRANEARRIEAARARLFTIFDPEDANRRAHADQAKRIAELGGRETVLAVPQWNFTPATENAQ